MKLAKEEKSILAERYRNGVPVSDFCTEAEIPRSTLYAWIKQFATSCEEAKTPVPQNYNKILSGKTSPCPVSRPTTLLNAPTVSHTQPAICSRSLKKLFPISASGASSSGLIRLAITVRQNAAIARISAVSTTRILSIRSPISMFSQLNIEDPPITVLCILYTITCLLLFFVLIPSNLLNLQTPDPLSGLGA